MSKKKPNSTQADRPDTYYPSNLLTPSEVESLKQTRKEQEEVLKRIFFGSQSTYRRSGDGNEEEHSGGEMKLTGNLIREISRNFSSK